MGKKTPARAKISTRKVWKVASQVESSYIQDSNGETAVGSLIGPMASSSSSTSNADILQYLQKIDASTQALAHRVEHIEHSANSTPIQNRQHSHFPESSAEGFVHAVGQGFNPSQTLRFQEEVPTHQSAQGGVQGLASGRGDRSDPLLRFCSEF